MDAKLLASTLKQAALDGGCSLFGIAPAVTPAGFSKLKRWLDEGLAGEMNYMSRRANAYEHPRHVSDEVKSLVVVALNYFDECDSFVNSDATFFSPNEQASNGQAKSNDVARGRIAKYATGSRDYHDVIKQKLKPIANILHAERPGCRTRTVVDTAPLLERDFAQIAGLGWFGKNTMLINKWHGSWFFLGVVLTDVELPPDDPHASSHCGTCTRCLDACPTNAFVEPYVLDARKCISYLTIELRDQAIDPALRPQMGEWIFGCDVCQDVCPWNRKAEPTAIPEFQTTVSNRLPELAELLTLDEAGFRERFRKTPMVRPKRDAFLRNAIIAAGNSKNVQLLESLCQCLNDGSHLVRQAAAWAISQLPSEPGLAKLKEVVDRESNIEVKNEMQHAIEKLTRDLEE